MSKAKKFNAVAKEKPSGGLKPVVSHRLDGGFRRPGITESADKVLSAKIAWNFGKMDEGGKCACSLALLEEFKRELVKCEGKTIDEVMLYSHNHPLGVNKIEKFAKDRLDALCLDIETLHQINIGTPSRLWGIREGNIFHILWLDKDHSVYKTKKHP